MYRCQWTLQVKNTNSWTLDPRFLKLQVRAFWQCTSPGIGWFALPWECQTFTDAGDSTYKCEEATTELGSWLCFHSLLAYLQHYLWTCLSILSSFDWFGGFSQQICTMQCKFYVSVYPRNVLISLVVCMDLFWWQRHFGFWLLCQTSRLHFGHLDALRHLHFQVLPGQSTRLVEK